MNKDKKWFNYLVNTNEKNYNVERVKSLKEITKKSVYNYVLKAFEILEIKELDSDTYFYVSEVLKWMDVAKTGSKEDRKLWKKLGFNLYVHNIGSYEIYLKEEQNPNMIVATLIKTHGLIGQYIRGEVNLDKNKEIYNLLEVLEKDKLKEILIILNECIIRPLSDELYDSLKRKIENVIDLILNNKFEKETLILRLKRLNKNIDESLLKDKRIIDSLNKVFDNVEIWYYEAALKDFSFEERLKILLYISNKLKGSYHITFEKLMKNIYFDYENKKMINIYKKRIIETLLKELDIEDILNNNIKENPHIKFKLQKKEDTLLFDFNFSLQTRKLIEFCEIAYTSNSLYNKSVYMLYDLFGFRRDEYDRFYNEIEYIEKMNSSINNKKVILDYIVGKNILDVGPGGGALMDLIESELPEKRVYGIDISKNVIELLEKKKRDENKSWIIKEGEALNLSNYFKKGEIDTIIYSSIIHELYSYIPYKGKKFNIETIIKTLKEAYSILSVGGRIVIRDGIETEPKDQYRIIEFNNIKDIDILNNYCNDFKGRKVTYEKLSKNKVKMLVNDAMEFLYTYTWGENSYSLEVKEQFGYMSKSEYINLIENNLENAKIIVCTSFLQSGYEENLLNKITIYDEFMNIVKLPDSTCIIVIERT